MSPTVLFTHLKIILLQCFQFSVFSFSNNKFNPNTPKNTCQYGHSYGDQSFANGDLGVKTLTIGSTTSHQVTIPKIVFGCGHNNDATFGEAGSGIIGLEEVALFL